MNFGKWLRLLQEQTLPEWRDYYVCYKILKKLIKVNVAAAVNDDNNNNYNNDYEVIFIHLFKAEVNKINNFMEKKCRDCSVRFQVLKDRIEKVNNMEESAREDKINEGIIFGKDLVNFYGELVLLDNYSVWNYTGLRKILKKYDRQTNAALGKRYLEWVKCQPCFQATGPLLDLIKECKTIWKSLLFSSLFGDNMAKFVMTEIFHNENEDEPNVYKSSVAALKILEEMMKISSAYNDDSS